MSSLKEKSKPALRRSRLEIVQAALAKDEAELEAARARFVELAAKEDEAVRESKRADAAASPYRLRAPAQQIREEREKLTKTIEGLEKGIAALQAEFQTLDLERAEKRLAEAVVRAKHLGAEERDVISKAATLIATLAKPWNARAALLEDRRALAESVRAESLTQTVEASRPDLVAAWEVAVASTLAPTALSFEAFVNALLSAALADRVDVAAEHAAVDELNARRREMARRDPGGPDDLPLVPRPTIHLDPLQEVVGDLRDAVRSFDPTIAGEPIALGRTDDGEEIEGLSRSGFGIGSVLYTTDGNARLPWRRSPGGEAA